jgi:hypothetical protein
MSSGVVQVGQITPSQWAKSEHRNQLVPEPNPGDIWIIATQAVHRMRGGRFESLSLEREMKFGAIQDAVFDGAARPLAGNHQRGRVALRSAVRAPAPVSALHGQRRLVGGGHPLGASPLRCCEARHRAA